MNNRKFQFHVVGFKGKKGYRRNFYHVSDFVYASYDLAQAAGRAFIAAHKAKINRPQVVVHRNSVVYPPKFDAFKIAERRVAQMVKRIAEMHLGVSA